MGKKSLTKSTARKKKVQKSPAKQAVKKNTTAKNVAVPKRKTAASPKKTGPVSQKAPSIPNLLLKKFDTWQPKKRYSPPDTDKTAADFTAPPFFPAESREEAQRLRSLLLKSFDYENIKAAAHETPLKKTEQKQAASQKEAINLAAADGATAALPLETDSGLQQSISEEKKIMAKKPLSLGLIAIAIGFILIVILMFGASYYNSQKYYLTPSDGTLELWKGKFAPLGEKLILSMDGIEAPADIAPVYKSTDVLPLAYLYFNNQADELLAKPGFPDLQKVKAALTQAVSFAPTDEMRRQANGRINNLEIMLLSFRADVAASKGSIEGYKTALALLNKAGAMDPKGLKSEEISQKVQSIRDALTAATPPKESAPITEAPEKEIEAEPEETNAEIHGDTHHETPPPTSGHAKQHK